MPDRASFVCGPTATIRSVLVPLIDRGFIPHAKAIRKGKTPAMLREYQHRSPASMGADCTFGALASLIQDRALHFSTSEVNRDIHPAPRRGNDARCQCL
jgi:hypothetical protein